MTAQICDILSSYFDTSSEEYKIIEETYRIITSSNPSIASEAKNHLIMLDHNKIKLSTIYYGINRQISELKDLVQATYDSQYTRLVKLGRPSKDAIEAEIRLNNKELSGIYKKIRDLEDVKELINSYIRCIDSSRTSTLEILRNIYRLD